MVQIIDGIVGVVVVLSSERRHRTPELRPAMVATIGMTISVHQRRRSLVAGFDPGCLT
jgi:hypothetical protein